MLEVKSGQLVVWVYARYWSHYPCFLSQLFTLKILHNKLFTGCLFFIKYYDHFDLLTFWGLII